MKNVALITGASSGIGKEFARIHAERKGDLVIIARNEERLNELKNELESKYQVQVKVIAKDLSQENAPQEIHDEIKSEGIKVEYLINNAGFGGRGKFHEQDWNKSRSMMQVNMVSLAALTHLFLPEFIVRNSGRILNTSSTASLMPGPLQAVYFATKAFVTFFSNALTEELRGTNVTVTNLMPGATKTEFAKTSDMDKTDLFKKAFPARKVAEDGYNAMLKGKMDIISGVTFGQRLMMRMVPLMPKKSILKQVRKMQEAK